MNRFPEFENESEEFWFRARFIAEGLGYTSAERKAPQRRLRTYTPNEIQHLFEWNGLEITSREAARQSEYSEARADAADFARSMLMTADEARFEYEIFEREAYSRGFSWDSFPGNIPMNKQKGAKKNVNFLTAFVNISTYLALDGSEYEADYDPRHLLKFTYNDGASLGGVSSRRLDGAIPSLFDPLIVWEIKEYYYTTTFGSRIADGVYETRLDGYEFDKFSAIAGERPLHILFTDSYSVWWEQGKSYLCRLIDMLNEGSVDRIYFGKEVLRWEADLVELLNLQ